MMEQFTTGAGVFSQNQIHGIQNLYRAIGHVCKVAYGRWD
jgi:hypothetical protein